jgi:hypothetical protein
MTESDQTRFKITYCANSNYREKADNLATELADKGQCDLIAGKDEEFEVEDKGVRIFSKNDCGRLPEKGEILAIVTNRESGMRLQEAQDKAAKDHGHSVGVLDWIYSLFRAPSEH